MQIGQLAKRTHVPIDTIRALVERGAIVNAGHTAATYEETRAGIEAGAGEAGAGEGNRTLVVSLGSFCSTIELHPQCRCESLIATLPKGNPVAPPQGATRQAS